MKRTYISKTIKKHIPLPFKKTIKSLIIKFIDNIQGPISRTKTPIFIVGCGHSGTTLMAAILNAHPNLYVIEKETYIFNNSNLKSKIKNELENYFSYAEAGGATKIVEKTPKHIHCIRRIFKFFPGARVIIMLRDGRDVSCSIRNRTQDFLTGVQRWVDDNKLLKSKIVKDNRILIVKYEDLIIDFKSTMLSVSNFISEEFTENYFHHEDFEYNFQNIRNTERPSTVQGKDHDKYRNWQVKQPIFDGRFKWKNEMTEKEKEIFKSLAGNMLIELGYESDIKW